MFALIACKNDLEEHRVVSEDRGKELAKSYHIPYFETSAKTGEGVNECFNQLIRQIFSESKIFVEFIFVF